METKEIIIDFMTEKNGPDLSTIHGEAVERGGLYKYQGVVLGDQTKGNSITELMVRTWNQRLNLLRILNDIRVQKGILTLFYRSTTDSIICFSVTVWYGKITCNAKNKLMRVVKKLNC